MRGYSGAGLFLTPGTVPSPKGSVGRQPDLGSSFGELCEPSRAPTVTWDQQHDECYQRGFRRKESKAVSKTRLTQMGATGEKRNLEGSALQDTPVPRFLREGGRETLPEE